MRMTLDFETYYDHEYSLKRYSVEAYCRDPRFQILCCVCALGDDWYRFSGDSLQALAGLVTSADEVVCHNAHFDGYILESVLESPAAGVHERHVQVDGPRPCRRAKPRRPDDCHGRSALEWVLDRYQVKTNKASGIKNDPNGWAKERNQPRYILDLLLRIMPVSVETMKIVKSLPKLDFSD